MSRKSEASHAPSLSVRPGSRKCNVGTSPKLPKWVEASGLNSISEKLWGIGASAYRDLADAV